MGFGGLDKPRNLGTIHSSPLRNRTKQFKRDALPASIRNSYGRKEPVSPSDPLPYIGTLDSLAAIPESTAFVDSNGELLNDEIFENRQRFPDLPPRRRAMLDGTRHSFSKYFRERLQIDSGVHLFGEYDKNYFHWVVETLPRLYAVRQLLGEGIPDVGPVVVNSTLPHQHYEALESIAGRNTKVFRVAPKKLVSAKSWLYSAPPNRVNDVFDRPYAAKFVHIETGLLREISDFVKSQVVMRASSFEAIYVRRPLANVRRPINEDALISEVQARAFAVMQPEQFGFLEQVRIFSSAKIIVAPSGAALANILWMRPGSEVIVLAPRRPFKAFPYLTCLAEAAEVRLTVLWQETISPSFELSEASWHKNYLVDVDNILKHLDR